MHASCFTVPTGGQGGSSSLAHLTDEETEAQTWSRIWRKGGREERKKGGREKDRKGGREEGPKEGKPSAFRLSTYLIFTTTICWGAEGLRSGETPQFSEASLSELLSFHHSCSQLTFKVLPWAGLPRRRNRRKAENMALCLSLLLCKMQIMTALISIS